MGGEGGKNATASKSLAVIDMGENTAEEKY